ncbi:DgyrCDS7261 [Dimorphilus gyrociliatus]|uniref:DgyrCDS7261 n=1 Tax=Dimorphilus gyrociliatus TaxID=2664684 RepID=A0A7I8VQK8_9ANNE|nr:DgyrCDS7261 [Dimorphilus gyrociliatus]
MVRWNGSMKRVLIQAGLKKVGKKMDFRLKIQDIGNETLIASVQTNANSSFNAYKRNEDSIGALYYVCVVVVIYGFGIVLMIGSVINKGKQDKSFRKYLSDMDKVKRLERKEEKIKTRLLMEKKRIEFQTEQQSSQRTFSLKEDRSDLTAMEKTPRKVQIRIQPPFTVALECHYNGLHSQEYSTSDDVETCAIQMTEKDDDVFYKDNSPSPLDPVKEEQYPHDFA